MITESNDFFALKKSGTTTESQNKNKLTPIKSIRKEKDHLIQAYSSKFKGVKQDLINHSSSNIIMAYAS